MSARECANACAAAASSSWRRVSAAAAAAAAVAGVSGGGVPGTTPGGGLLPPPPPVPPLVLALASALLLPALLLLAAAALTASVPLRMRRRGLLHRCSLRFSLLPPRVTVDDPEFVIHALNEALADAAVPLRLCHCAVRSVTLALRPTLCPLHVTVCAPDVVAVWHSGVPLPEAAAEAFKHDILFWDLAVRHARRRFFLERTSSLSPADDSAPASAANAADAAAADAAAADAAVAGAAAAAVHNGDPESTPLMDTTVPGHPSEKKPEEPGLGGAHSQINAPGLRRKLWRLLMHLVRLDVEEFAVRLEDAPVPEAFGNQLGYGFAISAVVDSLRTSHRAAFPKPLEVGEVPAGGLRRTIQITGFRIYFDPGVRRLGHRSYRSACTARRTSNESAELRGKSVKSYMRAVALPVLDAPSINIDLRHGASLQAGFQVHMGLRFDIALRIALREVDFQSGLGCIFRIVTYRSVTLASGASAYLRRSIATEPELDPEVAASCTDQENYRRSFYHAVRALDEARPLAVLRDMERRLNLKDVLRFRDTAELEELERICRHARRSQQRFPGLSVARESVESEFLALLMDGQLSIPDRIADEKGRLLDEFPLPELSFVFELPFVTVEMRESCADVMDVELDAVRLTCELSSSRIEVFDCLRVSSLLVLLDVQTLRVMGPESRDMVLTRASEGQKFLYMRFRQTGMMSLAHEAMEFEAANITSLASSEELRFILNFYVPVPSPRDFLFYKRVARNVAVARRKCMSPTRIPWTLLERGTYVIVNFWDSQIVLSRGHSMGPAPSFCFEDEASCSNFDAAVDDVLFGFGQLSISTRKTTDEYVQVGGNFVLRDSSAEPDSTADFQTAPGAFGATATLGHLSRAMDRHEYDGEDHISGLELHISKPFANVGELQSKELLQNARHLSDSFVKVLFVYVGAPYHSRCRIDYFMEVEFGAGSLRLRETALRRGSEVLLLIKEPVFELVEDLRLSSLPVDGRTEIELADEMEKIWLPYPSLVLSSFLTTPKHLNSMTGDFHLRLGSLDCDMRCQDSSGSLPFAFSIGLGSAYFRRAHYFSESNRILLRLNLPILRIFNDPGSAKLVFDISDHVAFRSTCAQGATSRLRTACVHSGRVSFRASSDLVSILPKLRSFWARSTLSRMAPEESRSGGNIMPVHSRDRKGWSVKFVPDIVPPSGCQIVLVLVDGSDLEVGMRVGPELGIVEPFKGLQLRIESTGFGSETGFGFQLCFLCGGKKQFLGETSELRPPTVKFRDEQAWCGHDISRRTWRLQGDDWNHIAIQNKASGRFLGIAKDGSICTVSNEKFFFKIVRVDERDSETVAYKTFDPRLREHYQLHLSITSAHVQCYGERGMETGLYSDATTPMFHLALEDSLRTMTANFQGERVDGQLFSMKARIYAALKLFCSVNVKNGTREFPIVSLWKVFVGICDHTSSTGDVRTVIIHGSPAKVSVPASVLRRLVSLIQSGRSWTEYENLSYYYFHNTADVPITFSVVKTDLSFGPQVVRPMECIGFDLGELTDEVSVPLIFGIDGFREASGDLGSMEYRTLSFIPRPVSGYRSQTRELLLKVSEDTKHGSIRLTTYCPITIHNHLPFEIELHWNDENGVIVIQRVPAGEELGISKSVKLRYAAVDLSGVLYGSPLSMPYLNEVSIKRSDQKVIQIFAPGLRTAQCKDHSGRVPIVDKAEQANKRVEESRCVQNQRNIARFSLLACVVPCNEVTRIVAHFAPCMRFVNYLSCSIDIMLDGDEGFNDCRSGDSSRRVIRRLGPLTSPEEERGILGDGNVFIFERADKSRYTLRVRSSPNIGEDPPKFSSPISFSYKGSLAPRVGQAVFEETAIISRGYVIVSGTVDDQGSLQIVVFARYMLKNNVPDTELRISPATHLTSVVPLPGRSSFMSRPTIVMKYGIPVFFDRQEALFAAQIGSSNYVTARSQNLPLENGKFVQIRMHLEEEGHGSGKQFVAEMGKNGVIIIYPLILISNCVKLKVRIEVGVYGRIADTVLDIAAAGPSGHTSEPFHSPHHHFESILKSQRIFVSADKAFHRAGPIDLTRAGTYALAVQRCPDAGEELLDEAGLMSHPAEWMIIGIDVLMESRNGRREVRILKHPRYGPTFLVNNFSKHSLVFGDSNPDYGEPRWSFKVDAGARAVHVAYSYIMPSQRSQNIYLAAQDYNAQPFRGRRDHPIAVSRRLSFDEDQLTSKHIEIVPVRVPCSSPIVSDSILDLAHVAEEQLEVEIASCNGFMKYLVIRDTPTSLGLRRGRVRLLHNVEHAIAKRSNHLAEDGQRHSIPDLHFDEVDNNSSRAQAYHVYVPSIELNLLDHVNLDEVLFSLSVISPHIDVLYLNERLHMRLDIMNVALSSLGKRRLSKATNKTIMTRSDIAKGPKLERRGFYEPALRMCFVFRIPQSSLNPTDILHFEKIECNVQPFAVKLDTQVLERMMLLMAYAFDRTGRDPGYKLSRAGDAGTNNAQASPLGFNPSLLWKAPIYFDRANLSPIVIDFEHNRTSRTERVLADDDVNAPRFTLLRSHIKKLPNLSVTIEFEQLDLVHHVHTSGELGSRLFQHPVRESLHYLRSIRPEFGKIEDLFLGRRKGPENRRRIGRWKAFLERKLSPNSAEDSSAAAYHRDTLQSPHVVPLNSYESAFSFQHSCVCSSQQRFDLENV